MNKRNQKGFTLIEVIVVAGIIAILAGILVPMIFGQVDEAKKTRALAEAKSIQSALIAFKKDVGVWPYNSGTFGSTTSDVTMLVTGSPADISAADLAQLTALGYNTGKVERLSDHLSDATKAIAIYGDKWKGPYLSETPMDPWGKAYIVPVSLMVPTTPPYTGSIWIFSPGPGGVYDIDTTIKDLTGLDDLGVRMQ